MKEKLIALAGIILLLVGVISIFAIATGNYEALGIWVVSIPLYMLAVGQVIAGLLLIISTLD